MDHKNLARLAKACRAAGIKHYKCAEFEFTLSDEGPISNYKKRQLTTKELKENSTESSQSITQVPTDSLTEEQLLLWSSGFEEESSQ